MKSSTRDTERVIAYIDGYNLYFGLCEREWRHYLWLDLPRMVRGLLKPHQSLVNLKYFTSRSSGPSQSQRRQTIYLDALQARGGLEIHFGNFNTKDVHCADCGRTWLDHEEKQTDVKIAVHMLRDAHNDQFDMALLISGDSDQVPTVREIEQEYAPKRVTVAFPPKRVSGDLKKAASSSFSIGEQHFRNAQLPSVVAGKIGYALCQPVQWYREP